MKRIDYEIVPYRYEPAYRPMAWLSQIPRRSPRFLREASAIAFLAFSLSIVMAASSGDLKNFRAYFLSTARDCAVAGVVSLAVYRALKALYGKP